SMAGEFGHIQLGTCVEIKRSDGRIHSALVTELHEDTSSITVEWVEKGTTKGKRVDVQFIFALNPHLAPRSTSTTSIEAPLTAKGSQSLVSGPLSQPVNVKKMSGNCMSPVTAQPDSRRCRKRWTSPCLWEIEMPWEQREHQRLDTWEQQTRQATASLYPRTDVMATIPKCRTNLDYEALKATTWHRPHQICVCIRKRPLNQQEAELNDSDAVTVLSQDLVMVREAKQKLDLTWYLDSQVFRFDHAFDDCASNELVYRYTAQPLVDTIFRGSMATCFAYGQSGSGKTHTMMGSFSIKNSEPSKGIYVLVAEDVFRRLQDPSCQKLEFQVYGAFFEIYGSKVFDLLNWKKELRVLEDGQQQIQVVGLWEEEVTSVEDVIKLIERGNKCRTSCKTSANSHSSRSHAIFQIILKKRGCLYTKFSLIDLAGNEQGAGNSIAEKQTRMEGADINKSLLALKECIRALGCNKAHTPFRGSKLTQVLRDSFIGENSCTCMIATICPGTRSCKDTLNTLHYASRVKKLVVNLNSLRQPYEEVFRFPHQLKAEKKPCAIQNCPRTAELQLSGAQADKEVSPQLFTISAGEKTQKERKEADEKMLMEEHQESPEWLKVLLEVAGELDDNVDLYTARFESVLGQKIDMLTKIQEKVRLFRSALCKEEQGSSQSSVKGSRML
ncbi:KIF2A protein, partial [Pterocles burchelli]|nr:KIF2A protein [Pterocles burchelli]